MAIYTIDADKAQALLPGNEIHPLRLGQRSLLVLTVIEYLDTNIGKYIEFSIAIACTHGVKTGARPASCSPHEAFRHGAIRVRSAGE